MRADGTTADCATQRIDWIAWQKILSATLTAPSIAADPTVAIEKIESTTKSINFAEQQATLNRESVMAAI